MSGVTAAGQPLSYIGIAAGSWFGEGTLLKCEHRKYDIVALRDSRLTLMPASQFQWLVENSPAFTVWLMHQLNERLGQFVALLSNDRETESDVRVARAIAWMFNPYLYPGMPFDLPITQDEVAHLAGVSRQRANAALKCLVEARLIEVGYGHVVVKDVEGLRNFIGRFSRH